MKLTTSLWLMNSLTGEFLIQLRGPNKKRNPNRWDTSAGGQLDPGETSLQAIKRETFEELGLLIPYSNFIFLGDFSGLTSTGKPKHSFLYFASCNYDIKSIEMGINKNEITMVQYAKLKEIARMVGSPACSIQPEKIKLLENYLKRPLSIVKQRVPIVYSDLCYN